MTVVTVGQVQKPLLDERVGLGRDIPNFPGALLVKIIVHGKPLFLSIPFFPAHAGIDVAGAGASKEPADHHHVSFSLRERQEDG